MATKLNPYLSFKNNARAAMEFYKSVFGGELVINTFKESGMKVDSEEENGTMHSLLEFNGMTLMASDTPNHMGSHAGPNGSISLSGDNEEELMGYWNKLAEGATITMPINKAPWGDTFGMLKDKFGIEWMVNIAGKKE